MTLTERTQDRFSAAPSRTQDLWALLIVLGKGEKLADVLANPASEVKEPTRSNVVAICLKDGESPSTVLKNQSKLKGCVHWGNGNNWEHLVRGLWVEHTREHDDIVDKILLDSSEPAASATETRNRK